MLALANGLGLPYNNPQSASGIPAPTLVLNLAGSTTVDARITYTRTGPKTYFDSTGTLKTAADNVWPQEYDPVTRAEIGRSIWEARTNLLYDSAQQSVGGSATNNAWFETFAELDTSLTTTVALDGTTSTRLIATNTTTSFRPLIQRTANTTAGTYTLSFYAKAASTDTSVSAVIGGETGPTNYGRVVFTLVGNGGSTSLINAGTATAPGAETKLVRDGWYRCALTVTLAAPTNITVFIYPGVYSNQTADSQTYIKDVQLELGAFPTPYIPTTSGTVTRSSEVAQVTGTSFTDWFNASEGTFVANSVHPTASATVLTVSNNSSGQRILMDTGTNSKRVIVTETTQQAAPSVPYTYGVFNTLAVAYKLNSVQIAVAGVLGVEDTSANMPVGVVRMYIGVGASGNTSWLNGWISKIVYYNTRLSDTRLQGLSL